ncbi:hypothetical protein [Actinacidiphila sp. bgisy144]|uniref:hypothetical protein n=1 Tax=unclassified Actinacidiphila TaxID=2995708 RepID=UPI003EB6F30E
MHRTTATAVFGLLAAAGLLLAGCSSSSSHGHRVVTYSGKYTPLSVITSEPPIPSDSKLAKGRTAACWKAIRDQYTPGTVQLTGAPTTPPECAGLTADEVSAVASDVLAHQLG